MSPKKSTVKKRKPAVKAKARKAPIKKKKVVKAKAKKVVAKKVTAVKKAPKIALVTGKIWTKTEIRKMIAAHTGITTKQVGEVFSVLSNIIANHLKKGAIGEIKLEGLLKVTKAHKPAKKARKGINPFTGEETMFKAKPAHNVIKVRALKKLKEMV